MPRRSKTQTEATDNAAANEPSAAAPRYDHILFTRQCGPKVFQRATGSYQLTPGVPTHVGGRTGIPAELATDLVNGNVAIRCTKEGTPEPTPEPQSTEDTGSTEDTEITPEGDGRLEG